MNHLTKLIFVLSFANLLSPVSIAESKQEEGETLIRRSEQVSNIRSADAPPFRLRANFTLMGNGVTNEEGAYTETWVSHGRWRRETTLTTFHRVEVGAEKTRWTLDNPGEIPETARSLGSIMQMQLQPGEKLSIKVASMRDQTVAGVQARCVELKYYNMGKEKLCIDAHVGVLLLKETPTIRKGKEFTYSCRFTQYEEFGGRMYPRHILCVEDGRPGIDIKVTELSDEPLLDSALFVAPSGAKELANCQGKLLPPRTLQAPEPGSPKNETPPNVPVVIELTVGRDGKPHDLEVTRSFDKAFDDQAMEAVGKWVFQPAKCDGDPVPVRLNIEVNFR